MRICYLGRANYSLLRRRAEALAALGHEIHIISLHAGSVEGCIVHALSSNRLANFPSGRYLAAMPAVSNLLKTLQPDLVDIHGATSYGVFGFISRRIPVVVTIYGTDIYDHARHSWPVRWLAGLVVRRADMIYSSTPAAANYLHSVLGWKPPEERLRVRSWGIPIDSIRAGAAERRLAIRREFSIDMSTRVILHSRHIAMLWRPEIIIEAAPAILMAHPNTEFWFAYPPPNQAGQKLLTHLQERVKQLGIENKVRFLGYHPYDQMISIMYASDIYVCIGIDDLLASSVLEALASGLIPVLSDLEAYREVVRSGENGFLLSNITPESLNKQLHTILTDFEQLRPGIATYNRKLVETYYDQADCDAWLLEQYQQLAHSWQSGPH